MEFRWNAWNRDHIAEHGLAPEEVEYVVRRARPPYPERRENEKGLVWGQTAAGLHVQVIYFHDPGGTIYVIHARPLKEREKRNYRRRKR